MHPLQIAAYRRMSPAEKLERIAAFQLSLLGLLKAGIRSRHPEWTEEEVASEVRERMLYAVS